MSRKFQYGEDDDEKNKETQEMNSRLFTHSALLQPSTDEQRLRAEISLLRDPRARMLQPFDAREQHTTTSFPSSQQQQRLNTAAYLRQVNQTASDRDQQMAFRMRDSFGVPQGSTPILPPASYLLSGQDSMLGNRYHQMDHHQLTNHEPFETRSAREDLLLLQQQQQQQQSGREDRLLQQLRLKTEQVNALRQEYIKRARARQNSVERKRKALGADHHEEHEAVKRRPDYRTLMSSASIPILPPESPGHIRRRAEHVLHRSSSLRAEDQPLLSSFAATTRTSMDSSNNNNSSRSQMSTASSRVVGDTSNARPGGLVVRRKGSAASAGPSAANSTSSTKKASKYQLLIRDTIEFFPVQPTDVALLLNIQGRKKKIQRGQVGIRCKYCAHRPPHWRGRGAVYFPGYLTAVYQSAQNMASNHFLDSCQDFPAALREELAAARSEQKAKKCRTSGGNQFWMATCQELGINERRGQDGLWMD